MLGANPEMGSCWAELVHAIGVNAAELNNSYTASGPARWSSRASSFIPKAIDGLKICTFAGQAAFVTGSGVPQAEGRGLHSGHAQGLRPRNRRVHCVHAYWRAGKPGGTSPPERLHTSGFGQVAKDRPQAPMPVHQCTSSGKHLSLAGSSKLAHI
jgi:hypothetical protein